MLPLCWKIYETGYSFREATDPSKYDNVKEYFSDGAGANLPWVEMIGSSKAAYRAYFFVVPFAVACLYAALKLSLPKPRSLGWSQRLSVLMGFHFKLPLSGCGFLPTSLTVQDLV